MKILVSGVGSIGQRHLKNLQALGLENLVTCDPHAPADEVDFDAALSKEKPDVVFVCSPTKLHVSQALEAAKTGAHLFVEKPLSCSLDGISELQGEVKTRGLVCMIGCNMRFHHGPATVRRLLDEGAIGTIESATVYTGSYLPSWRPQQDYKKSYSADPQQGGATLDCIHEIDLALWYLGPATLERAKTTSAASIGLPSVDGTADLDLRHASGAVSRVHLSFVEPEYRRYCSITGSKGRIDWDFGSNTVAVRNVDGVISTSYSAPDGYDINRMYVEELKHFLACVEGKRTPSGGLEEAIQALEIALEARKT